MKLQGKHYFDLFWIFFFAGIIITSLGYGYKARLIPLVVAIPCLAMAIYRFFADLKGEAKKGITIEEELIKGVMETVESVGGVHKKKKEKLTPAEKRKRFYDIALWIVGFVALIFLLGLIYAIPIFTFAYMRAKKESWVLSASCAVGLTLAVYLAFVVGTKSYLYEGILIPLIKGQ